MLNIPSDIKELYNRRNVPAEVKLIIDNTTYTARNLVAGSLSIIESLCSAETFDLTCVEKNCLEFTLFNENQLIKNLVNKQVTAYHVLTRDDNTTYEVPLGTYTIFESVNASDNTIKCTCYDNLLKFDQNIDVWWNETIQFPITIRNLVIALFNHLDISYNIQQTFVNYDYEITVRPTYFENTTAAELLGWIQEIVCGFFKADRYGVIRLLEGSYIATLFPRLSLYPRDGLYPGQGTFNFGDNPGLIDYRSNKVYGKLEVADYYVKPIEKVQIRGTEDDIGIIVGTGTNTYIIQGNPLLLNLSEATGRHIAQTLYDILSEFSYTPFTGKFQSSPYMEVGDVVNVVSYKGHRATSPIFYRVLNGQKLHADTYTAKGTEVRQTVVGTNKKLLVLNQKTHELVTTVDEFRSTIDEVITDISDLDTKVERNTTSIEQNSRAITLRATKTEAQQYASTAETNANNATDNKLTNYYTVAQSNAAIALSADQIKSTVGKATKTYDTTGYTITYYQYEAPTNAKYPPASNNGKYYLNVDDGKLYYCNGSSWTLRTTLTVITTNLQSQITQNANNISVVVSDGNLKTASIVTEINNSSSQIKINADKIDITGSVKFLVPSDVGGVTAQGVTYIDGGKITTGSMSANRISGGTLTLGGNNNGNGILVIKNASGSEIGKWDNTGISVSTGSITGGSISGTTISGSTITGSTIKSGNLIWYENQSYQAEVKGTNITADSTTYKGIVIVGNAVSLRSKDGVANMYTTTGTGSSATIKSQIYSSQYSAGMSYSGNRVWVESTVAGIICGNGNLAVTTNGATLSCGSNSVVSAESSLARIYYGSYGSVITNRNGVQIQAQRCGYVDNFKNFTVGWFQLNGYWVLGAYWSEKPELDEEPEII